MKVIDLDEIKAEFSKTLEEETMYQEMLDDTAKHCKKEQEEGKVRSSVEEILTKLNDHLASKEFNKMVNFKAKQMKVSPKLIKNTVAQNYLDRIGNVLGLATEAVGNAMRVLVNLVGYLLNNILNIAVGVLQRLFNVLTFKVAPVI